MGRINIYIKEIKVKLKNKLIIWLLELNFFFSWLDISFLILLIFVGKVILFVNFVIWVKLLDIGLLIIKKFKCILFSLIWAVN